MLTINYIKTFKFQKNYKTGIVKKSKSTRIISKLTVTHNLVNTTFGPSANFATWSNN